MTWGDKIDAIVAEAVAEALANIDAQLAEKGAILTEKDALLAEKIALLAEKDAEIARLKKLLAEKEAEEDKQ